MVAILEAVALVLEKEERVHMKGILIEDCESLWSKRH